ncbi:tyrosine-type recombinase/integrase [Guptibacillus spartinae]|uniref:tyrosine-type recombinase/integrase n=1 Tax=Guptibacillus spartinae TaxID=3025679 RepID=UPI0023625581|nr:site-specific integrase [Pseudalkalibacillus spartinae]
MAKDNNWNYKFAAKFILETENKTRILHKLERNQFDYRKLTDLEIIWCYINREISLSKMRPLSKKSKVEYSSELLMFNKYIIDNFFNIHSPSPNIKVLLSISETKITSYIGYLNSEDTKTGIKRLSINTIVKKTNIIRGFLKFLHYIGYMNEELHHIIYSPSVESKKRDIILNEKKLLKILKYYKGNPIARGLIIFIATTGLNNSEIISLKVNDLIERDGNYYIRVRNTKIPREILIPNKVYEKIIEYRLRRRLKTVLDGKDSSPLFTTHNGTGFERKFLTAYLVRKLNNTDVFFPRRVTVMDLRYFFANLAYSHGSNLFAIQKNLGHKTVQSTVKYIDKLRDELS